MLAKARKLALSLMSPKLLPSLAQGVAPSFEHRSTLRHLSPAVILDVGANRGQFSLLSRLLFPDATIIAFEPLARAAARIARDRLLRDNYILHRCAASDRTGTAVINVAKADDSSSLLAIGPLQTLHFPGTHAVATEEIRTERIDDLVDLAAPESIAAQRQVLMKVDVQGMELSALQGARDTLRHVTHALVELSFVELYIGQALAGQVINFLVGQGFGIVDISHVSRDKAHNLIQADFLFERTRRM